MEGFQQQFDLWPSFSTVDSAVLCSCCKWGFGIHNLRGKQVEEEVGEQFSAQHFFIQNVLTDGQHSLSFAFVFPAPVTQKKVSEKLSIYLFSPAQKLHMAKQIQTNTCVTILCLSWLCLLLLLVEFMLVSCTIKETSEIPDNIEMM